MTDQETTRLLREVVHLLRVLALPQLRELRQTFEAEMLASANRKRMWKMMDGTTSLKDIGGKVGTSGEAVRQFVAEIEDKWPDVIEVERGSGSVYPKRLI